MNIVPLPRAAREGAKRGVAPSTIPALVRHAVAPYERGPRGQRPRLPLLLRTRETPSHAGFPEKPNPQ